MGVNVPEEYGGAAEAGAVAYALAMMEIAQGCASTAVTMAVTNMVRGAIVRLRHRGAEGSATFPAHLGPASVAGALRASPSRRPAPTPRALRTTARRNGDGWVLNGSKQWITSGDRAGVMVVWARTGEPGRERASPASSSRAGRAGSSSAGTRTRWACAAPARCRSRSRTAACPPNALLGQAGQGFKLAMMALDGRPHRHRLPGDAASAPAALEASVRYAKERKAFGKPIADFQAIRFMLADVQHRARGGASC